MKKLNYWILMLLACVSVGFLSACGEDDDEPGSGSSSSGTSIVGVWYDESDGDKLVLSKDGTFELFDLGVVSFIHGTYTISGNRMVFTNEDGGQYKYTIVKQTKDELWLENENGDRQCWCRDTDNDGSDEDDDASSSGSEVSIIGIWYGYSENETMRYVFSEAGAFSVYDDDELTVSGTYTISGDHIIVETKHGDRYRITIGKLSETELVLLDEAGGEMEHLYRDY